MSESTKPPETENGAAPGADGDLPGEWQRLDLGGMRQKLEEIKGLLEQAVAVGLAQDMARLDALAELERRSKEDGHGHPGRRRYR
ncbi:MAG: hypothetical protein U0359_39635 [Byssovorax sp.]